MIGKATKKTILSADLTAYGGTMKPSTTAKAAQAASTNRIIIVARFRFDTILSSLSPGGIEVKLRMQNHSALAMKASKHGL